MNFKVRFRVVVRYEQCQKDARERKSQHSGSIKEIWQVFDGNQWHYYDKI